MDQNLMSSENQQVVALDTPPVDKFEDSKQMQFTVDPVQVQPETAGKDFLV